MVKSRRENSEAESSVWLAPRLRAGAGGTGDLQHGRAGGRGPRSPGMGTGCAASENISLLPEESCNRLLSLEGACVGLPSQAECAGPLLL